MSLARAAGLVLPLMIRGADGSPIYHDNIVQVPLLGRIGYAIVALVGLSGLIWCLGEFIRYACLFLFSFFFFSTYLRRGMELTLHRSSTCYDSQGPTSA